MVLQTLKDIKRLEFVQPRSRGGALTRYDFPRQEIAWPWLRRCGIEWYTE